MNEVSEKVSNNVLAPDNRLIARKLNIYFLKGLVIPFLFASIGHLSFLSFGSPVTRVAADAMGAIWPAFEAQYLAIERTLGDGQATSYAFFNLTMVLLSVYVSRAIIISHHKIRPERPKISAKEGYACLACVVLLGIAIVFDAPKTSGNPLLRFNLDSWGTFYSRQYALFYVASCTLILGVLMVRNGVRPDLDERNKKSSNPNEKRMRP